jgi:hypothetical protein
MATDKLLGQRSIDEYADPNRRLFHQGVSISIDVLHRALDWLTDNFDACEQVLAATSESAAAAEVAMRFRHQRTVAVLFPEAYHPVGIELERRSVLWALIMRLLGYGERAPNVVWLGEAFKEVELSQVVG